MDVIFIVLIVISSLLLVFFIGLFIVYYLTFYSPHRHQNDIYHLTDATYKYCDVEEINQMIKNTFDYPYEDAYISSFDHKILHARIYEGEGTNTICIMAHGYRGTACRDFSGGAMDMIKKKYHVILIDQRGHGLSQGKSITFGVRESKDIASWIKYGKERFGNDKRILLSGISMGGATVLFSAPYLSIEDKIIADCPYTDVKEIIKYSLKNMKISPSFFPFVNLSSIVFSHINLYKRKVDEYVKNSKAKILIIHGDNDSMVPHLFSYNLYINNKEKIQYELFNGAEHGLSYIMDMDRYQNIVNDFLKED